MLQSFYTGNTGLSSNKEWLSVISDNITNVNTSGFKGERVNFQELVVSSGTKYSSTGAPINKEIGGGTFLSSTVKDFSQGAFKSINDPLAMALDGEGFFMVTTPDAAQMFYTRDGSFRIDSNGDVITQGGYKLQGWMLDDQGKISSALGSMNVPSSIEPKTTTEVSFSDPTNLDAGVEAISATFDPSDPSTYHYVNTFTTYDSLGTSHVLRHYFVKTDTNTWRVYAQIDDRAVPYVDDSAQRDGTPNEFAGLELKFNGDGELISFGTIGPLTTNNNSQANEGAGDDGVFTTATSPILPGSIYITQDPNGNEVQWNDDGQGNIVDIITGDVIGTVSYDDGKITIKEAAGDGTVGSITLDYTEYDPTAPASTNATEIKTALIDYTDETSRFLNTGAVDTAINEEFNITQLDSDFIFYSQQNGSSKGDLMSVSVSEDGVLKATYTNGKVKNVAQLAIATFKDKESLVRKGNNLYLPNQQNSSPIIVQAGTISKIRSGMIEMSNVDISQEFINLITAQRAYQANAKTITTSDQILQTTMDIKR